MAPDQFDHRAHIRWAYAYLAQLDIEAALARMRSALHAFLRHNGISASKYHETMTRAWILAVRHFMEKSSACPSADAFIEANPAMLDSRIMTTHYSTGLLFSEEARARFVEPDLDQIPRYDASPHELLRSPRADYPDRVMAKSLPETLKQLEALGTPKVRAQNAKHGAGDNQFGVSLGEIRALAKKIGTDHPLALALWKTGNVDAQFLAALVIQPKQLSAKEMDQLVRSITFVRVADWLNAYVVRRHREKEALRRDWMTADDRWAARAGWDLTAERVANSPEGLDVLALLARIESEMAGAVPEVQWTMNMALATIGIHFPDHRKRAIAIGEKLGIYRDYPVSKGCTSPFAPIWIEAMVSRRG